MKVTPPKLSLGGVYLQVWGGHSCPPLLILMLMLILILALTSTSISTSTSILHY